MIWLAAGVIWIVCGVWAYGLTFGHFQRRWPEIAKGMESSHRALALLLAIVGPLGVFIALTNGSAKHGLKFRSSERADRCQSKH